MTRLPQDGASPPQLFPAEIFDGFGPSRFRPPGEGVNGRRLRSGKAARLLHGVKDHSPRSPGVYGMLDKAGRVVYIGKAKNLRARLMSYFRVNSRDPKAGRILGATRVLLWEQTGDEFAALLRELELIQRFRPKFNVLGQPGAARYHYVCLGRGPAPAAVVVKQPTGKELGCYGPLVSRHRSADAVRRLNDWFQLRDCPNTVPMAFADQREMFPEDRSPKCLRFELGTCRGPCAGHCTRAEYAATARAAKAFLDGRDRRLLGDLRKAMDAAAAALEFERATALRDRLASLEWLDDRLSLLRRARDKNSFVYPLAGPDGVERWYLIHRGQVQAVVSSPATDDDRRQLATTIRETFADTPAAALMCAKTVDSVLLVSAWFRKYADDKARLLSGAAALAACGSAADQVV